MRAEYRTNIKAEQQPIHLGDQRGWKIPKNGLGRAFWELWEGLAVCTKAGTSIH
jgi:hypothetical protein